MGDIFVIGIGNPFRGDDGAGWAVIDELEGKVNACVKLSKIRGDIAELLDVFASYSTVYVIDACSGDASPGSWQRLDARVHPIPQDSTQTSTHGFGLGQAIALAKTLDQLPPKLIIYAINGDHYNISATMSPPVAQATRLVAQKILTEEDIHLCTKKV
jgi:hydrogenase maturation protease